MKLTKQNVCVFIENKAQLQEAKELLEKYSEETSDTFDGHYFEYAPNNFLKFYGDWYLSAQLVDIENEITLSELEEILKNESK